MIEKKNKNFFNFIKKKIKKKKNIIKKSIIHNNQTIFKKILFLKIEKQIKTTNKISQLQLKNKKLKKKIFLNRWELYSMYTSNNLINFKK